MTPAVVARLSGHQDVAEPLRQYQRRDVSTPSPPEWEELPTVEALGWESGSLVGSAPGTGVNRTYSTSPKFEVLRCFDGHDYVLFFLSPDFTGLTFTRGPSHVYKITGKVAVIPQKFWDTEFSGVNPFTTMIGPANETVENRDVSHMILVQSVQGPK